MPDASLCSRCGAPAASSAKFCTFCGTPFREASKPDASPTRERELVNYLGALGIEGKDTKSGLAYALPQMLASDPNAARITAGLVALVDGFEKENEIALDATAAGRLFTAYLRARTELESVSETEMNLPFLAVHATKGPVHFQKTLTRADMA